MKKGGIVSKAVLSAQIKFYCFEVLSALMQEL